MDILNVFSRLSSKSKSVDNRWRTRQFPKEGGLECYECVWTAKSSFLRSSACRPQSEHNKRARLKRTQSFLCVLSRPSEYCPQRGPLRGLRPVPPVVGVAFLWGWHWVGCHCVSSPWLTGLVCMRIRVLLCRIVPQTKCCVHVNW